MSSTRPNVLLVVLDAARRDALEPYGAPAGATPAISALARRGHALAHAYATASWTLPSHASIFTGLLPRQLGLGQAPDGTPVGSRPVLEAAADQFLTTALRDAGYATYGFSANLWASDRAGFGVGFDNFIYVSGGRNERLDALPGGRLGQRAAWALEGLRSAGDDGARQLGEALRGTVERHSGRPAFWFVNLVEAHSPYLPPRPWNDLGARERLLAALEAQRHLNFQSICLHAARRASIPPSTLTRMRHLYARSISYMDAWLGRVLKTLARRGILEDTLVIITADHGESFGEDGLIAHGFGLTEPLIHVPLIMAGPGAAATDRAFSLAELPGLIARAAGVSDHAVARREHPPGIAVAQYDAIGPPDHPRIIEFAQRWELDSAAVARLTTSFSVATDGARKLVQTADGEHRYDLIADPAAARPLEQSTYDSFSDLRSALERCDAAAPELGTRPPVAISEAERLELERQMKLLGYM